MNSLGGNTNEVDVFGANANTGIDVDTRVGVGNFDRSGALEPVFSMKQNQLQNVGETTGRNEQMMNGETNATLDPSLQNALGVATVGAAETGVMTPIAAQMSGVVPHDNRTAEEIAIDAPEVAKDGDKMEKDWMDRARRAIHETKHDPNKRLLDVALLREEYMRKRFNRILGERNDS